MLGHSFRFINSKLIAFTSSQPGEPERHWKGIHFRRPEVFQPFAKRVEDERAHFFKGKGLIKLLQMCLQTLTIHNRHCSYAHEKNKKKT